MPSRTERGTTLSDDYSAKYTEMDHSVAPVTLEDEKSHFEALALPSEQTDI